MQANAVFRAGAGVFSAGERFSREVSGEGALVTEATSFGGIVTTAERRRRWGHDDVPEGFIRMSVGCEDVQDLIEDIGQALRAAHD